MIDDSRISSTFINEHLTEHHEIFSIHFYKGNTIIYGFISLIMFNQNGFIFSDILQVMFSKVPVKYFLVNTSGMMKDFKVILLLVRACY